MPSRTPMILHERQQRLRAGNIGVLARRKPKLKRILTQLRKRSRVQRYKAIHTSLHRLGQTRTRLRHHSSEARSTINNRTCNNHSRI